MAYNKQTLDGLITRFGLQVVNQARLFDAAPPVPISNLLREVLAANTAFALEVGTEKARSEFIVAPVLSEIREQMKPRVSLFSGVEFKVDVAAGLHGTCDFLLSLSPLQSVIQSPVAAIVEAKNDNLKNGLAQCLAEMIAAQKFNVQRGNAIPTVYGVVTTGSLWKFLSLHAATATIDTTEYYLDQIEKVVGVFVWMLREAESARDAIAP